MPFLFRPRIGPFIYTPGQRKSNAQRLAEIREKHQDIRVNLASAREAQRQRKTIVAAWPSWLRIVYGAVAVAVAVFLVVLAGGLVLG